MITEVVELKGEMWPEVTVYALLTHSPKDNVEVFTDFEDHKNFIPDIKESKIVKKLSSHEFWIEYKMKMPWPIEDSHYITANKVEQSGQSFKITWSLVKANQMNATKGTVLFNEFEGKTLLSYTSHITPNTPMAKMFTSRVDDDVEKTVRIIKDHLKKKLAKP